MAKSERGNLRSELNQLWKSTVDQLDEIKDVIVQGGQAGKARLDVTLLKRQREQALQKLGEAVLDAPPAALPEPWAALVAEIQGLDEEIAQENAQWETLSERVQSAARDVTDAVGAASRVSRDDAAPPDRPSKGPSGGPADADATKTKTTQES